MSNNKKQKTMKTRINEIKEMKRLHEEALKLLDSAETMQKRIDTKLQYNAEIAGPVGFKPWTDAQIDTCVRGRDRLMYSHLKVLMQIIETK